jgi:hypothetical protein
MSLIMAEARGGTLGAFNTENEEALKLLSTTFEYGKMRQTFRRNHANAIYYGANEKIR